MFSKSLEDELVEFLRANRGEKFIIEYSDSWMDEQRKAIRMQINLYSDK